MKPILSWRCCWRLSAARYASTCSLFVVRPGELGLLVGASGETVSLLPLVGDVHGITISGFYYPLNDATLRADRARGVSNVLLATQGTIAVRDGLLLVVHHFDDGAHQWRPATSDTRAASQ
jgi:thiamine pyrophosphokinase